MRNTMNLAALIALGTTFALGACAFPHKADTLPRAAVKGPVYRAVLIKDHWMAGPTQCSSAKQRAEGADIDSVLLSRDGVLLGTAQVVSATPGVAGCGYINGHMDPNEVLGAPDGNRSTGYLSLWGGRVGVEFGPETPAITPGTIVEVVELGDDECSGCKDEDYTVYLATDADCAYLPDWSSCAVKIGTGSGSTRFVVPGSAPSTSDYAQR